MHVGYVTNGVHFPTWSATEWKQLYAKHFDENFWYDQSETYQQCIRVNLVQQRHNT